MQSNSAFERSVGDLLREAGVRYSEAPLRGSVRPDFWVEFADGHKIAIEAKDIDDSAASRSRALRQAEYVATATGASEAWVVWRGGRSREKRLVTPDDLRARLEASIRTHGPTKQTRNRASARSAPKVFVAMPFAAQYEDVYFLGIVPAAKKVGAEANRVDYDGFDGDITDRITELIRSADIVVADLSDSRPNVLFETGMARAWEKHVILICGTGLDQLPFDVRNLKTIQYRIGQVHALKGRLVGELRRILGGVDTASSSSTR